MSIWGSTMPVGALAAQLQAQRQSGAQRLQERQLNLQNQAMNNATGDRKVDLANANQNLADQNALSLQIENQRQANASKISGAEMANRVNIQKMIEDATARRQQFGAEQVSKENALNRAAEADRFNADYRRNEDVKYEEYLRTIPGATTESVAAGMAKRRANKPAPLTPGEPQPLPAGIQGPPAPAAERTPDPKYDPNAPTPDDLVTARELLKGGVRGYTKPGDAPAFDMNQFMTANAERLKSLTPGQLAMLKQEGGQFGFGEEAIRQQLVDSLNKGANIPGYSLDLSEIPNTNLTPNWVPAINFPGSQGYLMTPRGKVPLGYANTPNAFWSSYGRGFTAQRDIDYAKRYGPVAAQLYQQMYGQP